MTDWKKGLSKKQVSDAKKRGKRWAAAAGGAVNAKRRGPKKK